MMNWSAKSDIHPVTVNIPSKSSILAEVQRCFATHRGFSLATLNLDHAVKLRRNPVFLEAYSQHTHVVADGNPVVWLSKLSGQAIEVVPGSELVEPIAALAAKNGVSVALIGSTDTTLEKAAYALKQHSDTLDISCRIAPSMGFDPTGPEADAVIRAIAESGAGMCFLALGAPRQEIFAAHAQKSLSNVGFASIGAGLDFLAGTQVRAPLWVRRIAAEWLWRLALSPRRLVARYTACLALLPALTGSALRGRLRLKS